MSEQWFTTYSGMGLTLEDAMRKVSEQKVAFDGAHLAIRMTGWSRVVDFVEGEWLVVLDVLYEQG